MCSYSDASLVLILKLVCTLIASSESCQSMLLACFSVLKVPLKCKLVSSLARLKVALGLLSNAAYKTLRKIDKVMSQVNVSKIDCDKTLCIPFLIIIK